jgi:hypothetical protein
MSGEVVELSSPDAAPACDGDSVEIEANASQDVRITLSDRAREGEEWLQVSHFATRGDYERQFSIVEPSEAPKTELEWKTTEAGASKHYLVVRDGAGGVSFATWNVCAR